MRVLLDANILISYLLTSNDKSPILKVVRSGILGEHQLLIPEPLLHEFVDKVKDGYLSERIKPEEMSKFTSILATVSETIPEIVDKIPTVTRDPKDDYLLAYAIVGRADYLVTGDKDLLVIGSVDNLKILTPRKFLEILK